MLLCRVTKRRGTKDSPENYVNMCPSKELSKACSAVAKKHKTKSLLATFHQLAVIGHKFSKLGLEYFFLLKFYYIIIIIFLTANSVDICGVSHVQTTLRTSKAMPSNGNRINPIFLIVKNTVNGSMPLLCPNGN